MAGGRSANRSRTPSLDALAPGERAQVLTTLLAKRPELAAEAEEMAVEMLAAVSIAGVASDVAAALLGIPLDALASRAGRVRGRGYVHEVDAACELVEEAIEPFMADLRRRASLGSSEAASSVAAGIVAGLHLVREPEMGTVLAYAGEDTPGQLADGVLSLAAELGVEIPPDAAEEHWADWCELA